MRRLTASAESCVFGKQSLGPLRCGRPGLGGRAPPPWPAPLLPKLRGDFAEFLDHGSPDRLGMFYPPTCVGLRYGHLAAPQGFFSEAWAHSLRQKPSSATSAVVGGGLPCPPAYVASRGRPEPRRATLLRHPVGRSPRRWCGNVDPLRIGYAFRPRLSPRLTLGGLASPRKPWVYGGGVFHAALATHASILAPGGSTAGHPAASLPTGRSPTDRP